MAISYLLGMDLSSREDKYTDNTTWVWLFLSTAESLWKPHETLWMIIFRRIQNTLHTLDQPPPYKGVSVLSPWQIRVSLKPLATSQWNWDLFLHYFAIPAWELGHPFMKQHILYIMNFLPQPCLRKAYMHPPSNTWTVFQKCYKGQQRDICRIF